MANTRSFGQFNVYLQLSSARVVTTSNLSASYNNGPSSNGVLATLTANSNGALVVDGTNLAASERILINGQTNQAHNGVYIVIDAGDSGRPFVLQRANDFQNVSQIRAGLYIPIDAGALLAGSLWIVDTPVPNYLGVDPIVFINAAGASPGEVTPDEIQNETFISGTATNVGDDYSLALNPTLTLPIVDFTRVTMTVLSNNTTTTPTLNVDGSGAFPILSGGSPVNPNDINVTLPSDLIFLDNKWHLLNPNTMFPWAPQDAFYWQGGDSGAADAYVMDLPTVEGNPYLLMLRAAAFANTGASTLTVNFVGSTLGPFPIVNNFGLPLSGGEIQAGYNYVFLYSVASSEFQLINAFVESPSVRPENIQEETFISNVGSNTADAYELTLSPAITTLVDFTRVTMVSTANTTTTPTLNVDGVTDSLITLIDGSPLSPGDIATNMPADLIFWGVTWKLLNPATQSPVTSQNCLYWRGEESGIVNAYEVTLPIQADADAFMIMIEDLQVTNTGASTLTVTYPDATVDGPSPIVNTNGSAVIAGQLLDGGNYILLRDTGGTDWQLLNPSPTGAATSSWVVETTTSRTLTAFENVITNNAGLVTLTVPATTAVGDEFVVAGLGAGGWLVQANTGQTINLGNSPTTVAGSLASTNRYDSIRFVCVVANTTFVVVGAPQGNITVA